MPESDWPEQTAKITSEESELLEVKKEINIFSLSAVSTAADTLISYFSCWSKLLRSVAWLSRFKAYLLWKTRRRLLALPTKVNISCGEIRAAEYAIISYVQYRNFGDVISYLSASDSLTLKDSRLRALNPVIIDGLLCVGGRLGNSNLMGACKKPVILPKMHPVTNAIICHYHRVEGHMGVTHTLSAIRRHYWIVQGAAAVRRAIGMCIGCKERTAKPIAQKMADLPPFRVVPDYPFASTGVDYFGPITVREGRKNLKRYGCLFTCLKTRAVHIEVSHALTTDSFLMALYRFIGRRGYP